MPFWTPPTLTPRRFPGISVPPARGNIRGIPVSPHVSCFLSQSYPYSLNFDFFVNPFHFRVSLRCLFFHFIGYTSNQKELPESGQLQHKSLYYIVHNIPPGYLPFMEIEIKITVCAKSCIHISNTKDKYTKKFFMTI